MPDTLRSPTETEARHSAQQPPGPEARRHDDWPALINTPVEIRENGTVLRRGVVEDAAADSSVLWIAADGGLPRELYAAALGHEVWIISQELAGTARYQMANI